MKTLDPNILSIITDKKTVRIFVFSDSHIFGARCYLAHGCLDKKGNFIVQTPEQEEMEQGLIEALKKEGSFDIVFLLGDLIEGRNIKAGGLDLVNADTDVAVMAAVKSISDILRIISPKVVISIPGSQYHNADGGSDLDFRVTKFLSLAFPEIAFLYGPKAYVKIGDLIYLLSHHLGGDYKKTPFAAINRSYENELRYASKYNLEVPNVYGFGHLHRSMQPTVLEDGENIFYGFVAPCQKIGDTHLERGQYRTIPDIGYMVLEQDGIDLWGRTVRTYKPYGKVIDYRKEMGIF